MADDPLLLQAVHGPEGLFERHPGIRPVQKQYVYPVRPQILQRPLAQSENIVCLSIAHILPVNIVIARLGHDNDIIARPDLLQGFSYILFGFPPVVGRGCIDQIDARLDCRLNSIQPDIVRILIPSGTPDSPCSQCNR